MQLRSGRIPACSTIVIWCVLLTAVRAVSAGSSEVPKDRLNIIYMMTDDQCTRSMGCYGTKDAKTPHLDRLAADGVVFDCHYDTTAICMASRATVMTGLLEYHTGCNFERGPLPRSLWENSTPRQLTRAGYRTGFAGKFGFLVSDDEHPRGILPETDFDAWGGGPGQTNYATARNASMKRYASEYPHSTRSYGAFGRDFVLESRDDSRPFFLAISFKAPHHPVTPDPIDDHVYEGVRFDKPANYGRRNGAHMAPQSRHGRQYVRFHDWGYSTHYQQVMALYYQQIYAVDAAVGMIRAALEQSGQAEATAIIFTSDNGFLCGSHGYGSKVLPYEESSRVPLIMYLPGHPNSGRGLRSASLTGNVDFHPTILHLAQIEDPGTHDGHSLLPLYDNPHTQIHESLPLMNVWGPKKVHSFGVVTAEAKLIRWPWEDATMNATTELYDLQRDRAELVNLIEGTTPEVQALKRRMKALYEVWQQDFADSATSRGGYRQLAPLFALPESNAERPLLEE